MNRAGGFVTGSLIRPSLIALLALALDGLAGASASAQSIRSSYALGLSYAVGPDYPGAAAMGARLRPVLALRYGRLRLSSSGGSSVLNFGSGTRGGSGASADLFDIGSFRIRGALRLANGRQSDDFPALVGLPDIERTVIGRLSASYRFSRRLNGDVRLGWDLLGRGNGVTVSAGLHYQRVVSPRSVWSMAARLTWADSRHMNAWFGVPASAQTAQRPEYTPAGGLRSFEMSMGIITRLRPRWVMFARLGAGQLVAGAAASPLVQARVRGVAQIGIGYTCCRAR